MEKCPDQFGSSSLKRTQTIDVYRGLAKKLMLVAQGTPYERYKLIHGHLYQKGGASKALVTLDTSTHLNSNVYKLYMLKQLSSDEEMGVDFSWDGHAALKTALLDADEPIAMYFLHETRISGGEYLELQDEDYELSTNLALHPDIAERDITFGLIENFAQSEELSRAARRDGLVSLSLTVHAGEVVTYAFEKGSKLSLEMMKVLWSLI